MINEVKFIVRRGDNYTLIAKILEMIADFVINNCAKNGKFKCVFNPIFYYRAAVLVIAIVKLIREHKHTPKTHDIAMEKFIIFDNLLT
jgi:hypothetical protein